ncbi:MAG: hypothetical protein RLZZ618_2183 [Pseudomonadota bacterium]|jgi:hypothetical protein
MHLFGIPLHKPNFSELTAAMVVALVLWLASLALVLATGHSLRSVDAGAALIVSIGSSVAFCMGIRLNHGPRHLAANVIVSAVLLSAYVMAQKLLF